MNNEALTPQPTTNNDMFDEPDMAKGLAGVSLAYYLHG
jgi:hypothetical protein